METPPFMKSWVDLSEDASSNISGSPQPPQEISASESPAEVSSTSLNAGASTSDLPPAVPHSTGCSSMINPMTSGSNFQPYLPMRSDINESAYLKLLKEAQRESRETSGRASQASSVKDTPFIGSPKSPPNSPNPDRGDDGFSPRHEEEDIIINYIGCSGIERKGDEWVLEWSSRPYAKPPKDFNFIHQRTSTPSASSTASTEIPEEHQFPPFVRLGPLSRGASLRRVKVGKSTLFSRDVLYTLLISNVLSLLIGTGIGMWLSRKPANSVTTIATLPFI